MTICNFNLAYEPLSKQKAPKVLADALTWVDQALTDFGIAGLSLRGLIEFLKTALKNSNAAVRTNATKILVTVKLFAGSSKSLRVHRRRLSNKRFYKVSRISLKTSIRNC